MEVFKRRKGVWTIAEYWKNHKLGKISYSPKFQRESVWSEENQSYFIDSLVKGIPCPPIFLHEMIDTQTGEITYEIIDGKQRLESIKRFLGNEIPIIDVSSIDSAPLLIEEVEGKFFSDLVDKLEIYRTNFWSYEILIEYVNSPGKGVVEQIFDRLNRNGETLKGQELRNAQFHDSNLMLHVNNLAEKIKLDKLPRLETKRMADKEFISEMIFLALEGNVTNGSSVSIDDYWKKYRNLTAAEFQKIEPGIVAAFDCLKQVAFKITGITHLYAVTSFIWFWKFKYKRNKDVVKLLNSFYYKRSLSSDLECFNTYQKAIISRTKDISQRQNRVDAILTFADTIWDGN